MAIPDFQTLMLPTLRTLAEKRHSAGELIAAMADEFGLTEEERQHRLPSGKQRMIANRVHWALLYLTRAGLLARVARGVYEASERGRAVLAKPPAKINIAWLHQYEEFRSSASIRKHLESLESFAIQWRRPDSRRPPACGRQKTELAMTDPSCATPAT